jgi:hypothetical protein
MQEQISFELDGINVTGYAGPARGLVPMSFALTIPTKSARAANETVYNVG